MGCHPRPPSACARAPRHRRFVPDEERATLARMGDDIRARIDRIRANTRGIDGPHPDLYMTQVHARAALRRYRDTLDALRAAKAEQSTDGIQRAGDAGVRVTGEAAQAVVALYLAAAAAKRFSTDARERGPYGPEQLDQLVAATVGLRDAVMHWDDKIKRDGDTFLAVNEREVLALVPRHRSVDRALHGLTWKSFEDSATRLDRWATSKIEEHLSDG